MSSLSQMVPFSEYMRLCLYRTNSGFYRQKNRRTGSRGSFITSPSVGPLYGAIVARWVLKTLTAKEMDPTKTIVFDIGANQSNLLRAIARSGVDSARSWELISVDYDNADMTPQEFEDADLTGAFVIANELLDNLCFDIFTKGNDTYKQVFTQNPTGLSDTVESTLVSTSIDHLSPLVRSVIADIEQTDTQIPALSEANRWVTTVLGRHPTGLLVVDYGARTTSELVHRGRWLRTYRDHQLGHDPFVSPRSWDITTDVAFDQLPPPTRLLTQKVWLEELGIWDLVKEGDAYWVHHKANPDTTALAMASRKHEALTLCDPKALGGWLVAEYTHPPTGN